MFKKIKISYNLYFHLPFLLWMVSGAVLLLSFTKEQLFASVNTHYTVFGDTVMYYTTFLGQPEVIIPGLLSLLLIPSLRNGWYLITAICCNITPLLIQQWLKRIFHHPRPLSYFHWFDHKAEWLHYLPQWPELLRNSFPSGHSQGSFSFFCFLTLLLPKQYQKAGLIFFVFAISVCYSRLYLAAHFFADVYTGSMIGAVTTTLIFSLLNRYRPITKIV